MFKKQKKTCYFPIQKMMLMSSKNLPKRWFSWCPAACTVSEAFGLGNLGLGNLSGLRWPAMPWENMRKAMFWSRSNMFSWKKSGDALYSNTFCSWNKWPGTSLRNFQVSSSGKLRMDTWLYCSDKSGSCVGAFENSGTKYDGCHHVPIDFGRTSP